MHWISWDGAVTMIGQRGAAYLKNSAATVGSTATLHCTTTTTISGRGISIRSSRSRVHWDNYAQRNPTVYNGHELIRPLRQRYRVNNSSSSSRNKTADHQRHELVIIDVRMSDAGNYSCYAQSQQPSITALLIVLSSTYTYTHLRPSL